jgi:tetratricopeptide (TPR) repeat protein
MNPSPSRHAWIRASAEAADTGALRPAPQPTVEVRCHRRLRGPYTGGGAVVRQVVSELSDSHVDIIHSRSTEIIALAPELGPLLTSLIKTLTSQADRDERTRFYPAARTLRIGHGVAELITDWARLCHPDGAVLMLREVDEADATDRELLSILLRRCDPRVVTLVIETDGDGADDAFARMLAAHADQAAAPPQPSARIEPAADLAQLYIDSDGTGKDPALLRAYSELDPDERARRHTARAEELSALGDPSLEFGAILYHLEYGVDPVHNAVPKFVAAGEEVFNLGYYASVLDIAMRGRQLYPREERPASFWNLTAKVGSCLSYLGSPEDGLEYFAEMRYGTINPESHMNSCYMMAMLYTRHLPKDVHDEMQALEWANIAISLADRNPDPRRRTFFGAFMRNGRALVELHRGRVDNALALVNEAIEMTDGELSPDDHLLHRSVLVHNRAQIMGRIGDYEASLRDYDEVISRDPEYSEYYFDRAAVRRAVGMHEEAIDDYTTAIRLSPPFYEAHFNRAELFAETGEEDAALRDLDYALVIEPDHLECLVHRVDLLLRRDDIEAARADIERGLGIDPKNPSLLCARGSLLAESDDADGAFASYAAALAEDPTFTSALANRAVLFYTTGQAAEAVADLERALSLEESPMLRVNRAIAFQDLGEHRRAVEDLDVAIAAAGQDEPDLFYRRGVSRHALEDVAGAHADWRVHLAGYREGEISPYLAQIELHAGDLISPARVSEPVS